MYYLYFPGTVSGTANSGSQKQQGSATYTYQSFTPYTTGQNPFRSSDTDNAHGSSASSTSNSVKVENPNTFYSSYSYAAPSSYSSTIRRIPKDPNDPQPELLPAPNAPTLNNSSPPYPVPVHQFSSVLDSSENLFPHSRLSYSQISRHFQHDDETIDGRKIFKNPRNVPSEQCPRDEQAALRMVRGSRMYNSNRILINTIRTELQYQFSCNKVQ